MQIQQPPASPGGTGDDPDYTTISGGKRRQWTMEMESSRAAALPGRRTHLILLQFVAVFRQWTMENISWLTLRQDYVPLYY